MNKKIITIFVLLLATTCYANFFTDAFTFELKYSYYPDLGNLYFLPGLKDPSLFPQDPFLLQAKNSFLPLTTCCGFIDLYLLFMHLFPQIPFILIIKIIAIILTLVSAILIYKLGTHLYSTQNGLILSALFTIYFLSMDSFYGGEGRGLGVVIFCLFLLLFCKKKFIYLPLLIPLALFCYPYLAITLTISVILIIPLYLKKLDLKKYLISLSFSCLLFLLLLLQIKNSLSPQVLDHVPAFGNYKYSQALATPINPKNILHILFYFILNLNEHSLLYRYLTIGFLFLSAGFIIFRYKKAFSIPDELYVILISSFLGFFILYPFNLFGAGRQLVFTIPLVLIFFIAGNFFQVIKKKFSLVFGTLIPILFFIGAHPFLNNLSDYKKYTPIYNYLKKLPPAVNLAGMPQKSDLISTIPLYTKRSIFFSDNLYPMWLLLSQDPLLLQEKRFELLKVLYTNSFPQIKSFITRYQLNYFIIEEYFYSPEFLKNLKPSPFKEERELYQLIKNSKNPLLLSLAKENSEFQTTIKDHHVWVLDSQKIMAPLNHKEHLNQAARLHKKLWTIEENIIKNSSFVLTGPPKNVSDTGTTLKYFLSDNSNQKWLFKVEPFSLDSHLAKLVSHFFRFCGFNTPVLTTIDLPINGKSYHGEIQYLIPQVRPFNFNEQDPKGSNTLSYLKTMLAAEVICFLFNEDGPDYLLDEKKQLHLVDINDINFVPSLLKLDDISIRTYFLEEIPYQLFNFIDLAEFKNNLKEDIPPQISYNQISNWKDFYPEPENNFRKIHQYILDHNLTISLENVVHLISFINSIDNRTFISLLEDERLQANPIYQNYLQGVLKRKKELKMHFNILYTLLSQASKGKIKFNIIQKDFLREINYYNQLTQKEIKTLKETENNLLKESQHQPSLNTITCPEAIWILSFLDGKIITADQALKLLDKIKEDSNVAIEKAFIEQAINHIENKKASTSK